MRQSENEIPSRNHLMIQSTMSKINKLVALFCELASIFIVVQFVCIEAAQTNNQLATLIDRISQPDNSKISPSKEYENFHDQIVWDERSLYRHHYTYEHPESLATKSKSKRHKRASSAASSTSDQQLFVDACQSKMQVLTPYYGVNSKGKIRIIVNSELMQQAIQVETCVRSSKNDHQSGAAKCKSQMDCECEQKYKWHRLLVMEHPNESKESGTQNRSLFMDWFLFPSSCVCRCRNSASNLLITQTSSPTKSQHHNLPKPSVRA